MIDPSERLGAYDKGGPFGDPDGSREDFKRFIAFEEGHAWGGLSTRKDDLTARVIVGGKGSGKTIYKRMLEDYASSKTDDLYVFRQTLQLPSTRVISKFASLYPERPEKNNDQGSEQGSEALTTDEVINFAKHWGDNLCTEQFQLLWRRAIFRSIASLFYCQTHKPTGLTNKSISDDVFYDKYEELVGREFITPESVFNQITAIVGEYSSAKSIDKYLNNPLWESLERIQLHNLRNNRPICFFIDAIDEDFRHAPAQWMDCQKGLFYCVMRLLRDHEIVNSLHVTICIRDIVLSSVLHSSEHGTRFFEAPHIRVLDWGVDAARRFLRSKIAQLPDSYFLQHDFTKKIASAWLGQGTIRNSVRNYKEDIEDYILRHTRFLPRDIVNMGNALCVKVEECRAKRTRLAPADIRQTVSRVSSLIGNEAIRVCGNHLAVASLPRHALNSVIDVSREYPIVSDWAGDIVKDIVRTVGKDVFSYDELLETMSSRQSNFDEMAEKSKYRQYRVDTVLWQHGILGYRETARNRKCVFYSTSPTRSYWLPPGKAKYVFHPSMIDILDIRPIGRVPIGC